MATEVLGKPCVDCNVLGRAEQVECEMIKEGGVKKRLITVSADGAKQIYTTLVPPNECHWHLNRPKLHGQS